MSSFLGRIRTDCQEALKKRDTVVVSTLRLLLAALHEREIEKRAEGKELTEEEILGGVRKEAKKRKEAIAAYEQGQRQDLAEKEKKELAVLENYLPEQMGEEELKKIVQGAIEKSKAEGSKDTGKVMGLVMVQIKGRAEGKKVSQVVREALDQ